MINYNRGDEMEDQKTFYIEKDGTKYKANILTNFELYNNHYCIYTIPSDTSKNYNVYCSKIIENNLVKIEDEQEIKLTNKIVTELMNSLKKSKEDF